ncbi:MAG: hypothetical protein ABWK01_07260 [Infirmifilum sp.]
MKLVTLKVSGIGCASCVAPAKEHFMRLAGVQAVYSLGSYVYLVLDDDMDVRKLLAESSVEEYYNVRVEGIEHAASLQEAREKIRSLDRKTLSLIKV